VLDRIRELASGPGSLLGRLLRRLAEIGGVERATVLGAQAFTALIPYLVVASAVVPRSENENFAETLIDRFDLEGRPADGVRALFASAGEVESGITLIGIGVLLITVVSFARALQNTYERSYGLEPEWRLGPPAQPAMLLGRRVAARVLVPGAIVSGVLMTLLVYASAVYMPILIEAAARRYGLIGIAFSLQGWLLTLSLVIVAGAVVGGVLSEDMAPRERTGEA
jgi:membrane protein